MLDTHTFSDEKFLTAAEKGKLFKAWQRFIWNGFSEKAFTKPLYRYLTLHCSFIAHYNKQGFYVTYFDELSDFKKFWNQFGGDHRMAEGYGTDFRDVMTWGAANALDLNRAMIDYAEGVNATVMRIVDRYGVTGAGFSVELQRMIAASFGTRSAGKARQQAKARAQARQQKMQMALF